jgi:adenylate cyclase
MTEERVKRKISAILSADVAGYSRLMGEDEVSTVKTLEAYRKVMSDLIEQFRGRVVDSPGDNLLAEFSSVVDAVQCAVEIHEVIRAKNEELPEDRRMLFRIGVNLGDVIEEGDRIYGDGVNIAARLEGLAEAGGICISGSAHEQIENKLALGYEYIGEHTVKNIAKPVKVYRVPMEPKAATLKEENEKKSTLKNWQWTALGAAGAIIVIIGALAIWTFYLPGPSIEPASIEPEQAPAIVDVKEAPKTIAVLPFVDLSPEKDQEYFVDGLSEELINCLTQISDLHVTSRQSSFTFKGSEKTTQEIANILGREYILEGSVRKAGNALRISAQLIHATDDHHLWSKTYDRELKDIFAVQEDIATAVADELKVTLGIGKSFKQLGGTENVEAYELYLNAKWLRSTDVAMTRQGLESIDAAIALDPEFALAWAEKANIHIRLSVFGPYSRSIEETDAALRASQKAVELEPNLGDGYIYLGYIKLAKSEWIEAEHNFRKALELIGESLSSDNDYIIIFYLTVGKIKRMQELLEEMRRNDPFNQAIGGWYYYIYGFLGDRQKAEEEYQRRNKLLLKGFSDWHDDAITRVRLISGDVLSRDEIVSSNLINITLKEYLDSPEEGLMELRRIYRSDDNLSHYNRTIISIWACYFGDPEFAMEVIEKSASINVTNISDLWDPVMQEFRQTPRFKEFVREIGLVDYWNKFGWPDLCRPVGDDDFVCD